MSKQTFHPTLKEAKENCKSYYEKNGQLRDCTCGTCPTKQQLREETLREKLASASLMTESELDAVELVVKDEINKARQPKGEEELWETIRVNTPITKWPKVVGAINQLRKQAIQQERENIVHHIKTMNQGVGVGAFVKNLIWYLEGKTFIKKNTLEEQMK